MVSVELSLERVPAEAITATTADGLAGAFRKATPSCAARPAGWAPPDCPVPAPPSADSGLCLTCGLCCDGTLFRDVELADDAEAEVFDRAGLPPRRTGKKTCVGQPCPALGSDGRCGIYAERPVRCRQFDCALLLAVRAGRTAPDAARRVIHETRQQANHVRSLLRALGATDETRPLTRQFQTLQRAFEAGRHPANGATGRESLETYAELTLAVQQLQLRLRASFYP